MSRSKEKFLISYILLVGIPLLGLAGVLGAGRSLTAPLSVAGNWDLQIDRSKNQSQSCVAGLVFVHPTTMDISQSGEYLRLTLNSQVRFGFEGALRGKTIVGSSIGPLEAGCSGAAAGLSLTAEIDPRSAPRIMSGVLSLDGCPSCGSANFQAVRQVLPTGRRSE
jgi:hypothetical protein